MQKAKRLRAEEEVFFAVVWLKTCDSVDPVAFASSHRDAQLKVDALTSELDAGTYAGVDLHSAEDEMSYFYSTADGKVWEYDRDLDIAKPVVYKADSVYGIDAISDDEELIDKHVTIDINKKLYHSIPVSNPLASHGKRCSMLCEDEENSMEYNIKLGGDEKEARQFWQQIRRMPYEQVLMLQTLYGCYKKIPTEK